MTKRRHPKTGTTPSLALFDEGTAPASTSPPAETPARHAHRFASYRGDVTADLMAERILGPTTKGEPLVVLYAHYDPVEDKTRAGLTFALPADLDEQMAREMAPMTAAVR